mgnify:FL=1
MEIVIKRIAKQNTYTIGRMYILKDEEVERKVNSRIWFHRLVGAITAARDREESIWITII